MVIVVSVTLFSSLGFSKEKVTILTEDYPPLNYLEDGILKGPAVEIVQKMKQKLNVKKPIKVYPWARAYKMIEKDANIGLFSTIRNKKRDMMFKWVGPLAEKRYSFYAKSDSKIVVKNFDDAKKYSIGVMRESATEHFLKSKGFKNMENVTVPEQNIKKLLVGRFDLWYASNATVNALSKKLNIKSDKIKEIFIVKESVLYIAFNNKTSDKTIKLWRDTYDVLYKNGTVKKIFKKYDLDALYPTNK